MSNLLKEAIEGLHINVPIYRTEEQDGLLVLYLYGGQVVHWPPTNTGATNAGTFQESDLATKDPEVEPDPATTRPALATATNPDSVTTPLPSSSAPLLPGSPASPTDNLTKIPGVGKATAAALAKAGFNSFRSLITADDADILAVPKLNTYTLTKIRSYLYIHFL